MEALDKETLEKYHNAGIQLFIRENSIPQDLEDEKKTDE